MDHVYALIVPFSTVLLSAVLAWVVTIPISTRWATRQKRRELEVAARRDFYRLYGDFFATWKMWNYLLEHPPEGTNGKGSDARRSLLERACRAEAEIEAILVGLAAERDLSKSDLETLGCFRQAYQRLREHMRAGEPLRWGSSSNPEYIAFKRLSCRIGAMFAVERRDRGRTADAEANLIEITSNKWEDTWARR